MVRVYCSRLQVTVQFENGRSCDNHAHRVFLGTSLATAAALDENFIGVELVVPSGAVRLMRCGLELGGPTAAFSLGRVDSDIIGGKQ